MAVRLEKAFGADRQQLLDMQAAYERQKGRAGEKEVAVRAFVPPFLTIKAKQIEAWADLTDTRTRLPVLLRMLVHSTGSDLHRVDFPGYDNAQRKGPDGFVKAGAAIPWVPKGKSYWEFGTTKDQFKKAEEDYTARLTSINQVERANGTFIFVTPRNWPGKTTWEKQKNGTGDWRAVLAFDASDIEQWLEQSVPGQIWLAAQLNLPACGNDYETLEQAWCRWVDASEPPLTPDIFASSIAAFRQEFKTWLEKPCDRFFTVAADSRDEALAFLACLFDEEEFRQSKDLAAIFTSSATIRTLVASSVPFIPIVHSAEAERELLDTHQRLHCIAFRSRNAINKADITLDLLNYDAFEKALTAMGIDKDRVNQLARESCCSPTILRRRLSQNSAIRTPVWAGDNTLVPLALIGAWHAEAEADRKIVASLAGGEYKAVAKNVTRLLQLDDSPVWFIWNHCGVVSKIDALSAIAQVVTAEDLKQFFTVATQVLAESDPALELPEDDRWAAAIYDKKRAYSEALRDGICETLVILSVHGNNWFQKRLGTDFERLVADLVRQLLTPLTPEKLLSHNHELPYYAEAAPDEFLEIIQEDLSGPKLTVLELLKPVKPGVFSSPLRSGLLWALECLAWKPQNLLHISKILAQLSGTRIDDNWLNKPDSSLQAIFRSWLPQTAALVEERVKVLQKLTESFPDVVWAICIEQIRPGFKAGHYNYRPRWRSDASGAGGVVTREECYDFYRSVLDLLITWPSHKENILGELVKCLEDMSKEDQTKVWDLIGAWSRDASEVAKAALRERIRQLAFGWHGRPLGHETHARACEAYDSLRPDDPIIRHGWLFTKPWIHVSEVSADKIEEGDFTYQKHDAQIDRLRREAIAEIWRERGFKGVRALLTDSDAADTVGRYVASCIASVKARVDFVRNCLSLDGDLRGKAEGCLQGFLRTIEDDTRARVLQAAAEGLPVEDLKRLFVCAPFQASTWRFLDGYGKDVRAGYWQDVFPTPLVQHTPAELIELIDCFLEAHRPRAAFYAVHIMGFEAIETSHLKRLLRDVATVNAEPPDHLDYHYISDALSSLNGRRDVTRDEMAQLEFLFIDVLSHSEHGIPNLESWIMQSPQLFVQVMALAYKRSDKGEDPPEWRIRAKAGSAAHCLLDQISKIPGTDENGKIDAVKLSEWLTEARRSCSEYGRTDIGDYCLGELLARAPAGENGIWPCEAVYKAMEQIASRKIAEGFMIGVRNARGSYWRGKGGEQERELAKKYHTSAKHLYSDFPYVGQVLKRIAQLYENDAEREDSRAQIEKRRGY